MRPDDRDVMPERDYDRGNRSSLPQQVRGQRVEPPVDRRPGGGSHEKFYNERKKSQAIVRNVTYWTRPSLPPRAFGYGAGWRRQFPWFSLLFTAEVFSLWYPPRWQPYYLIDPHSVDIANQQGLPPPPNAYRINHQVKWPENLPSLPTFKESGIVLEKIHYGDQTLTKEQSESVMEIQHSLNKKQAELKLKYNELVKAGYWPVPDLDRERFSWVKVVPQ